jgi:hypothetical protein
MKLEELLKKRYTILQETKGIGGVQTKKKMMMPRTDIIIIMYNMILPG